MIPAAGWLTETNDTNANIQNNPLPLPFEATYVDSTRRGSPADIVARTYGASEAVLTLQGLARTFTVTLRQNDTEGVVLVDRIE